MPSVDDAGVLAPPVSSRDHAEGPADAPVTLVEYGDYECPHCGRALSDREGGPAPPRHAASLRVSQLPAPEHVHPHAEHAAEAAEAAAAQGRFWEMHDALFEHQPALADEDLARYAEAVGLDLPRFERELRSGTHKPRVDEDFASGIRSGVNGTPTFFIDGRRYDGSWDEKPLGEADRGDASRATSTQMES